MSGTKIVYWDSCIFIAHLKNETHRPGEIQSINDQALHFDMGLIVLATSSIALLEILPASLDDEQKKKFKSMLNRSNFQFIETSHLICERAAEIRDYYKANPVADTKLPGSPDCIHIASAIAAQEISGQKVNLVTLDSDSKSGEVGLTKLSGVIAGKYQLEICRPDVKGQQIHMFQNPA
jgi:hypothetical protein